jgi:hypothetical protein
MRDLQFDFPHIADAIAAYKKAAIDTTSLVNNFKLPRNKENFRSSSIQSTAYEEEIIGSFLRTAIRYSILSEEFYKSRIQIFDEYHDSDEYYNYQDEIRELAFMMHGFQFNCINSLYNLKKTTIEKHHLFLTTTEIVALWDRHFPYLKDVRDALMHSHNRLFGQDRDGKIKAPDDDVQNSGFGTKVIALNEKFEKCEIDFHVSKIEKLTFEYKSLVDLKFP